MAAPARRQYGAYSAVVRAHVVVTSRTERCSHRSRDRLTDGAKGAAEKHCPDGPGSCVLRLKESQWGHGCG